MSRYIPSTIVSCTSCMFFIELLNKRRENLMTLFTFATFVFISLYGLIFTSKFFTVKRHIPLRVYLKIALIFFIVNLANNQSLQYNISVPICIVFRSASLLVNMAIGYIFLNKRYTYKKLISVILVSVGIYIFILSSDQSTKTKGTSVSEFVIGITLLSIALFLSSYLGIIQEDMYKNHGKYPDEASFYIYLISLPYFIIFSNEIHTSLLQLDMELFMLLLILCVLQLFCINSVYALTTEFSSLSVTMVLTLRKFISVIISVLYFGHVFTMIHIISLIFVGLGTLLFYSENYHNTTDKKKFN